MRIANCIWSPTCRHIRVRAMANWPSMLRLLRALPPLWRGMLRLSVSRRLRIVPWLPANMLPVWITQFRPLPPVKPMRSAPHLPPPCRPRMRWDQKMLQPSVLNRHRTVLMQREMLARRRKLLLDQLKPVRNLLMRAPLSQKKRRRTQPLRLSRLRIVLWPLPRPNRTLPILKTLRRSAPATRRFPKTPLRRARAMPRTPPLRSQHRYSHCDGCISANTKKTRRLMATATLSSRVPAISIRFPTKRASTAKVLGAITMPPHRLQHRARYSPRLPLRKANRTPGAAPPLLRHPARLPKLRRRLPNSQQKISITP